MLAQRPLTEQDSWQPAGHGEVLRGGPHWLRLREMGLMAKHAGGENYKCVRFLGDEGP